jgi:capsular exopolysaccharide synthesis family protein
MLPSSPQPFPDDADVLELRDYLAVVRRRRTVVIGTVVAVVAVALAVSLLQTPVYEASAEILLQSRRSEEIFSPDAERSVRAEPARVETEIGVMKSRSVREAVAKQLGRPVEVTIQAQGQTDLVTISAENTEPAEAASIAQTYAEVYIATRRTLLIQDLETAITEVQGQIADIEDQLDESEQRLADFDAQASALPVAERLALESERAQLEQEISERRENVETRRSSYLDQLDELELASRLTQTGGAQIVSEAVEPTSPVRPTPLRNGVLALVVGLMLGVGLAFLREYLDDTIKTKDELQQAAGGLPVLGLIPRVAAWKDREVAQVVSISEPRSAAAEAYRSLRTSVQFVGLGRDEPVRAIQLTSPNASEGKTTTLANLAVALAGAGQRVIVVCADLRRPRVHDFFGLANDVGFTSVLLGQSQLSDALQAVPGQSRLAVMTAGTPPPNPSELLAAPKAQQLLGMLRAECDVLLIDSPPVLPLTDAIVLAGLADATVLVGTAGRTTRKEIHRSVELLHQVGAPLVGVVLNGAGAESGYGYGYGYGAHYGADEAATKPSETTNGTKANGKGEPAPRGRAARRLRAKVTR